MDIQLQLRLHCWGTLWHVMIPCSTLNKHWFTVGDARELTII
jgi:hypothetical protein